MKAKLLGGTVLAICTALALSAAAGAGGNAETKVTIKVDGRDFSGLVKSERPRRCADERKVTLWKQKGSEQDRSVDQKVASDFAERNGDRYEWNTGNTGLRGKFYARAGRIDGCRADSSRTLRTEN